MCDSAPLEALPNEVFASILNVLPTRSLPPLVAVNQRFYCWVAHIIHSRLTACASLPDNELILECYHPSAKISTPYLSCRYLGLKTAAPSNGDDKDQHTRKKAHSTPSIRLPELHRMYSSFRPVVTEENRWRRFRVRWPTVSEPEFTDLRDETAVQDVFLDEGEMFSQLCATTTVVKEASPKRGLFYSHVNISDGVVRVFRDWLQQMAGDSGVVDDEPVPLEMDSGRVLWVDPGKSVGLRFRVVAAPSERMPLIAGPGEEPPVSYTMIYEELLVRTSMLLFAVEEGAVQEVANSGKAIVIASM